MTFTFLVLNWPILYEFLKLIIMKINYAYCSTGILTEGFQLYMIAAYTKGPSGGFGFF